MTTHLPERWRDAEDALHESATTLAGGLTDFGPDHYRTGLRVLLEAMDETANVASDRRSFAFGELAMTLAARLHSEAGWAEQPEILKIPIRAPLIVAGLPRSCTTVLQRLLAVDPQFQFIDSWLTLAPQPRPAGNPRESAAYRQAVARFEDWFTQVPNWRSAHDMAAEDPEECIEILRQDFVTNRFGCNFHVPDYDAWWMSQSEAPSYQRWGDILRLMGANDPNRCWLLKNPGHIYQMDKVLEIFPDARIIYTHRDPLKSIPSVASVIHMAHQIAAGDAADPLPVGPREVKVWSRGSSVMRAARARNPEQFFDVQHGEYVRDPIAVVKRIYAHFSLSLLPNVENAMQQWVTDNPQGKHGEHHYDLQTYGLTETLVRDAFADYIAEYGPF